MAASNKPSHLRALLRKNWILWKRSWCISTLEFLVPLLFALIMVAFRKASPVTDIATETYFNQAPHYSFDFDDKINPNLIKNCLADENGGQVAIVPHPSDDPLADDIYQALSTAGYDMTSFKNNEEIDDYTSQLKYASLSGSGKTLCFAIVINKNNVNNHYEYMLRWNISSWDDPDLPDTSLNRLDPLSYKDLDSMVKYSRKGFLTLQNFIDNLILKRETLPGATIKSTVTSRTVEKYVQDDLATNLKGQTRLFLDLPLLLPYLRFMNGILTEKEKKIREGMKIMGLKNSAFYLSWLITYTIIFTIASVLVSLALTKHLFTLSKFGYIFLWHWEFSLTLMAMGFLITIFFNKAKVGNVAGFVVALFLGFLQSVAKTTSPSGTLFGISFAPQTSMGLAADHILNLEAAQLGLNSDTVNLEINGYKMNYHYIVMFIDLLLFLILGTYLDKVVPSEFGIRKHPLFCLMRSRKPQKKKGKRLILNTEEDVLSPTYEQPESALKAQDDSDESIKIQNLRKVFPNKKVAVDSVSFNMYKGQIFALLGHNGAEKPLLSP